MSYASTACENWLDVVEHAVIVSTFATVADNNPRSVCSRPPSSSTWKLWWHNCFIHYLSIYHWFQHTQKGYPPCSINQWRTLSLCYGPLHLVSCFTTAWRFVYVIAYFPSQPIMYTHTRTHTYTHGRTTGHTHIRTYTYVRTYVAPWLAWLMYAIKLMTLYTTMQRM